MPYGSGPLFTAGANAANTTGGNKDWGTIIQAGAQIVGGLINSRGARQANQMSQQDVRDTLQSQRADSRESNLTAMQREQDQYAREIMRNRRAIAPYAQMYSGPRFEGVDPNAPIYNPLMEEGSLYQQLSQPAQMPWEARANPPRGG